MKKAIITIDDKKKVRQLNLLNNPLVVVPKSSLHLIKDIRCEYILTDDLKKTVQFLNIQSKVNTGRTVVILDCLRYKTWNNTIYNKIYILTEYSKNTLIMDDFPFVFDKRNIFVIMKILKIGKYHHKQFYDDSFYVEKNGKNIKSNSIDAIYDDIKDYLFCDSEMINFMVHEWTHNEDEYEEYDKYKYRKIFIDKVSKIKAVTGCTGRANRMESKQFKLSSVINDLKNDRPVIIYNWAKGITESYNRFGMRVQPISYHQESNVTAENVIFLETIISQKIKFYKKLKKYHKSYIHFFINYGIGADRMINHQMIESINDLNEFYKKNWKNEGSTF